MSVTTVLFHLLVVLVAAKVAAELAERVGVPAVVGEILAGILIGPSALGLVHGDEVVRVLGEIGVILLLLEVGLEMDIAELASVGRAAMLVAIVGVVAPFVLGGGVGLAFGMSGKEALFVGAALTATSVGITARVFGDLKVLATVEARTVLGAAVADDVIGLVILTVVVRLVTAGSVSVLDVGQVVLVALIFLVGATAIGLRITPPIFHWVDRHSRSAGTLVAIALAFTLAMAELANSAKLAPIVGAFVAGVVLSRSSVSERVRTELTPVGHLLHSGVLPPDRYRRGCRPVRPPGCARDGRRAPRGGDRRQVGVADRHVGFARRPRAGRSGHDPPGRGRADLRHHRSAGARLR